MRKILVAAIASVALLGACADTSSGGNQKAAAEASSLSKGIDAFKAGQYAEAEANFQQALASDPNDPYANLNMGVLKALQGDDDAALAFYRAAAENGENSPLVQAVNANGRVVDAETTVAAVARGNIERLDL